MLFPNVTYIGQPVLITNPKDQYNTDHKCLAPVSIFWFTSLTQFPQLHTISILKPNLTVANCTISAVWQKSADWKPTSQHTLFLLVSTYVVCERLLWCTSRFLDSKFWSKFSRKPLSGIEDQKAPPPFRKTSDLEWPKFTPEYPPHFGKLQIWNDQSLLRNTPPISESFRFGMTKVYSRIPPPPPISESFRFGMTKVYSGIRNTPPNENCQRVQVRDFQNTESYYMWRLYPTRITTSS